jgi:hypothetical protein
MRIYKASYRFIPRATYEENSGHGAPGYRVTNRIHGIKETRAVFGLGLRESKEMVEKGSATVLMTAEQLGHYHFLIMDNAQKSEKDNIQITDVTLFDATEYMDLTKAITNG